MKLETWQKDLLTNPNTTGALELFRFMGYEPEYLITFAAVTLSVDLGENVQLQFRLTEPDEGGCRQRTWSCEKRWEPCYGNHHAPSYGRVYAPRTPLDGMRSLLAQVQHQTKRLSPEVVAKFNAMSRALDRVTSS